MSQEVTLRGINADFYSRYEANIKQNGLYFKQEIDGVKNKNPIWMPILAIIAAIGLILAGTACGTTALLDVLKIGMAAGGSILGVSLVVGLITLAIASCLL